ncbi:unnamed protein product [Sympodiomycopsis kandeliae]
MISAQPRPIQSDAHDIDYRIPPLVVKMSNRNSLASTNAMSSGAAYPISPPPTSSLPSSLASRNRSSVGSSNFLSRSASLMSSASASSSGSFQNSANPAASSASTVATSSGNDGSNDTIPDLLEAHRDKTKNNQVAASSLSFLYAEMVSYTQGRVSGIGELERKLSLMGYHHGQRLLPLLHSRLESPSGGGSTSSSKNPKRETRLLPALLWVHGQVFKALFGKPADSLERSTERSDEYMISFNTPMYSSGISIPKDMSQLSVEAYTAGIIEAVLDGLGFPARVTAHSVPTSQYPLRTTILIKLDKSVMSREEAFGS